MMIIAGVYESKNIQRKVEVDWNMTYLARVKSANATISWNFDLASSGKLVSYRDMLITYLYYTSSN